jgi:hypothetical protein
MRRHLLTLLALLPLTLAVAANVHADWIFLASTYSHNPATGERVNQYAQPAPSYNLSDDTYVRSGFRHNHISIQAGGSQDHMHVVETWGRGEWIRPYGEWERPYRAGATPYGPWGNPQGPWTLPFDSWNNPYGLGRYYGNPWGMMQQGPMPYRQQGPTPYGNQGQMNQGQMLYNNQGATQGQGLALPPTNPTP